jgi:ABC-type transporter Mla maintaining outer membrane lipid asymmetry ATPase subunit MlaF
MTSLDFYLFSLFCVDSNVDKIMSFVDHLKSKSSQNKMLIICGPSGTGKETLVNKIQTDLNTKFTKVPKTGIDTSRVAKQCLQYDTTNNLNQKCCVLEQPLANSIYSVCFSILDISNLIITTNVPLPFTDCESIKIVNLSHVFDSNEKNAFDVFEKH